MYWDTNTVPSTYIEDLLNSSNITLERLLEEESILQECKGENTKVIDFLTKPDILQRLVYHVVTEPEDECDMEQQYRYASVAAEIFACNIPAIVNQLSSQHQLLDRLYQLLLQPPPLNPLLASFFAGTISLLIVRRSEQSWYSYQVNCPQVMEYLKGRGDFIDRLLTHIGTSAIMDLLCALTSNIEVPECRLATLKWLNEQRLVQRLAAIISDSQSAERQSNAAEALVTMLNQARQRENQMVGGESEDNPLIDTIESREFIDLLLDSMLSSFSDQSRSPPLPAATTRDTSSALPLYPTDQTLPVSSNPVVETSSSETGNSEVPSSSTDCEMAAGVSDVNMESSSCVSGQQTAGAECDVSSSGSTVAADSGGGIQLSPDTTQSAIAESASAAAATDDSEPRMEVTADDAVFSASVERDSSCSGVDGGSSGGGGGRGSALVHGVPVLLCLLDTQHAHPLLSGATSSTTPAANTVNTSSLDSTNNTSYSTVADESEGGSGGNEWNSVQLACDSIMSRLSCLNQLLIEPPVSRPPMVTSCGPLHVPPLGVERLYVAQLVTALVAAGRVEVNAELCRLDMLNTLLDLFFKYSLNNFLHAHVERCVSYVLLTDCKHQTDESPDQNQLLQYLLSDCRLLERILEGLSDEINCPDSTPPRRCFRSLSAYRGHLVGMANCVHDATRRGVNSHQLQHQLQLLPNNSSSAEQQPQQSAAAGSLSPTIVATWNQFCDTQLQQINNRNKVYDLKMNEPRSSDSIGFISQNQSSDFVSADSCRVLTSSQWKEPDLGKSSSITDQLLPTADSTSWEVDEPIAPGYSFLGQSEQSSADTSAEQQFERQCGQRISSMIDADSSPATPNNNNNVDDDDDVDRCHSSDSEDDDTSMETTPAAGGSSSSPVIADVWSCQNDEDDNDENDGDEDERQSIEFDDDAPWPSTASPMDMQSAVLWGESCDTPVATAAAVGSTPPADTADGWANFDAFGATSDLPSSGEQMGSESGDGSMLASSTISPGVEGLKSESTDVSQCKPCFSSVSADTQLPSTADPAQTEDNCTLVTSSRMINGDLSEVTASACTNSTL